MPIATVICDKGHESELVFRATVGATKAAESHRCHCGHPVTVDWSKMGGKVKMAFREGHYEIGDDKVYCGTKQQYINEAHKRGMYVKEWA